MLTSATITNVGDQIDQNYIKVKTLYIQSSSRHIVKKINKFHLTQYFRPGDRMEFAQ